ncbi:MAG TPA: LLM class flavin-dependent oxidoreductase [Thermodesulfobacteriota bacterium]|nr:LLM class flavin-dependent oxidoreductase [Thermodesulfobacteriota bacterium]
MGKDIKFGLSAPMPGADLNGVLNFSVKADKLGFDSVWYPDHVVFVSPTDAHEAWTIATVAATKTKNIRLGTVSDPHRMHPAVFAQRLATIDHLSEGRVCLTLGVGESMNLDAYGIKWDRPLARLREAMKVMQMLWKSEGPVDFHGNFYTLSQAFLQVKPYKRDKIPMYIATHTPKGLRLTGELGDGWLPIDLTPGLYAEYLNNVKQGAQSVGRTLDDNFDPGLWVFTSLGKNVDEAYKTLEPFKYVLIMQEQLKRAGYDIEIPEDYKGLNYFNVIPQDAAGRQKFREIGKFFPREAVLDFTITGSKRDCIKKIEKYIDKGVRHFVLFYRFSPDPEKALKTYAKQIIPYFKNR